MTDDTTASADPSLADDPALPDDLTHRRRVDDGPPSEAVVETLADALDRDPLDLPPLNDVLDPDALDALFADTPGGTVREGAFVFECCGCTVAVLGSDEVGVHVAD